MFFWINYLYFDRVCAYIPYRLGYILVFRVYVCPYSGLVNCLFGRIGHKSLIYALSLSSSSPARVGVVTPRRSDVDPRSKAVSVFPTMRHLTTGVCETVTSPWRHRQSSRGEVAPLIPFPDLCYRCLSVGLFTWQARLAINGPEWRWSGGFSELSQRPTTTNLFARPRRHPTKPPQDHKMYSTGWRTFGNGQVSKDVYSHRALQASVTGRRSTKISTGGQSNLT